MACPRICFLAQARAILSQVQASAVTLAASSKSTSLIAEAMRIRSVASGISTEIESRKRPAGRADLLFEEERQAVCAIADRLVSVGASSGEIRPLVDLLAHPQLNDPSMCSGIEIARLSPIPDAIELGPEEESPGKPGGSWIPWALGGAIALGVGYAIVRASRSK